MRFEMFKKSQAALEFLTTYGWAFLIILIMIGALAYFGILSPSKVLPNRCSFGTEFTCLDHKLTAITLDLRLKNNVGEAIDVTDVDFETEAKEVFTCTNPTLPTSWKSGDVKELSFTACDGGGLIQGEKGKVGIVITYNNVASGSTYSKQVKGEVYSTVQ